MSFCIKTSLSFLGGLLYLIRVTQYVTEVTDYMRTSDLSSNFPITDCNDLICLAENQCQVIIPQFETGCKSIQLILPCEPYNCACVWKLIHFSKHNQHPNVSSRYRDGYQNPVLKIWLAHKSSLLTYVTLKDKDISITAFIREVTYRHQGTIIVKSVHLIIVVQSNYALSWTCIRVTGRRRKCWFVILVCVVLLK